jgi:hypothetical protein
MRRARRLAIFGLATVATGMAIAGVYGRSFRSWMSYDLPASTPARWWRCEGMERSKLLETREPWKLTYSWRGGFGPGDVEVEIESSGEASLRTTTNGQLEIAHARNAALSPELVRDLASVVDSSGLMCQLPERRVGYMVHDLGRFSIKIASGSSEKEIFLDGCYTLPDVKAFDEVAATLRKFRPILGDELSWGPIATASSPRGCSE